MTRTLPLSSLLVASLALTAACDKKDSKKNKEDNSLPSNTAEITANSLARSRTLSRQLAPAVARSIQGFAQVNPSEKMTSLWNAVSGQTSQVLPAAGSDPMPGLRKSFQSSLAKQNIQPLQKLAQVASDENLEELVDDLLEAVLQEKHADFMADGMIFYRLDGLNPICEGEEKAECLKAMQSFRLGLGNFGDEGLSVQLNHLRQGLVTLKLEPSKVAYSLNFTSLNAVFGPNSSLGFVGTIAGSWALTETSSTMSLAIADELIITSKDEPTSEASSLVIGPSSITSTLKQETAESYSLTSSVKIGRITLKSGESRLEFPGLDLNTLANEDSWKTSLAVPQGSFTMVLPSDEIPGSTNKLSVAFDNDLRASIESNALGHGEASLDAVNVRWTANQEVLATLSVQPAVKAKLGLEGIRVLEGKVTYVMDGESLVLLQPQTCYRPVMDEADDDTSFDEWEEDSGSFLLPVPCKA